MSAANGNTASKNVVKAQEAVAQLSGDSKPYLSPFIDDGYTAEYTIPEIPDISSPVFIRYRPLTTEDESVVRARGRIEPDKPWSRLYAEIMVGNPKHGKPAKLLGWNLNDRTGQPVPITVDNICRLKDATFQALLGAMMLGTEDVKNS